MKNKILDFVIVGAPKCGTTALYKLLDLHPEICFSNQKEPRFFTQIKGGFGFLVAGKDLDYLVIFIKDLVGIDHCSQNLKKVKLKVKLVLYIFKIQIHLNYSKSMFPK